MDLIIDQTVIPGTRRNARTIYSFEGVTVLSLRMLYNLACELVKLVLVPMQPIYNFNRYNFNRYNFNSRDTILTVLRGSLFFFLGLRMLYNLARELVKLVMVPMQPIFGGLSGVPQNTLLDGGGAASMFINGLPVCLTVQVVAANGKTYVVSDVRAMKVTATPADEKHHIHLDKKKKSEMEKLK